MKFSIIMPSHLSDYDHAAKHRVIKFHRAINSIISQTFKDWELIVIADGCNKTMTEINKYRDDRITAILINKQEWNSAGLNSKISAGRIRNTGINEAVGEWIAYLDTDDFWGCNHLKNLNEAIKEDTEWMWFCDYKWVNSKWKLSKNSIEKPFHFGTANVAHRKLLNVLWPEVTKYGYDDLIFVQTLKKFNNFVKANGQYFICHVPKNPIFESYDI